MARREAAMVRLAARSHAGIGSIRGMLARMTAEPPTSPSIAHFEWGRITVTAYGDLKDAKLWPGGGALIHSTC